MHVYTRASHYNIYREVHTYYKYTNIDMYQNVCNGFLSAAPTCAPLPNSLSIRGES